MLTWMGYWIACLRVVTKCLESELRPLVRLRENTRPSVNMATIRLERKNGRNGAEIEDWGG